jgi:hypothetical protein
MGKFKDLQFSTYDFNNPQAMIAMCDYQDIWKMWAYMQRSKFSLEVQTCSCFSQLKVKIALKQELNIPDQSRPSSRSLIWY